MEKIQKLFLLGLILTTCSFPAEAGETLKESIKEGTPYVDLRFRFEHVNQDGFGENANAKTIKALIGYKSGMYKNFMGHIELEAIENLGEDDFNNTINGNTIFPIVADVESADINQAYLQYNGIPDTMIKTGQQVLTIDNQRFIGDVGWRQNNQTFDAAILENKSIEDMIIKYGFIYNVNRIQGNKSPIGDFSSRSHYYNISNSGTPLGKITTYGYILDFLKDSPGNSSQTYGLSLSGKVEVVDDVNLKYYGEYAHQVEHADNTTNYDANYYHVAPSLHWKGLSGTVGYEVLGSDDGSKGFATPLATLHKFNGWADKFLGTPVGGLEDLYFEIAYKVSDLEGDYLKWLNGILAKVQYHDFSAEEGGADYGTEWGMYLKKTFNKHVYADMKYADYNADTFATDTKKLVFGLGLKF